MTGGQLRIGVPEPTSPPEMDLHGRPVAVFGMARSGMALTEFLVRRGAVTTVFDEAPAERLTDAMARLGALPVRLIPGAHSYEQLSNPELVVTSPAVPVQHPLLQAARASGATVIGEVELAYRFCPVPIIAVTGTNGKGTTVTLLGDMLNRTGIRAAVGGNIGVPLISLLDSTPAPQVIVAEISSFQLETVDLFRPWIGVLLNISPDHGDRHPDLEQYLATKCRLFARQSDDDIAILNADDIRVAPVSSRLDAQILRVSLTDTTAHGRTENGTLMVELPGHGPVHLCRSDELTVPGRHHMRNTLFAAVAAATCGASSDDISAAARDFSTPRHLMEDAGTVREVRFINDSKATNPAAAIADLSSIQGPLILIAGGHAKSVDLSEYADVAAERARHIVLIGESAATLASAIADRCPVTIAADMEEAVQRAFEVASSGDTVLMAPGCASYDMFAGMAARGDAFCREVKRLASQLSP